MKSKGVYQRKPTTRIKPTHDYLKYWRVIRYWVKAKYGLSTPDRDWETPLDFILRNLYIC